MKALCVTSWEKASGKTMLCIGIGQSLKNRGLKVGYLKPAGSASDSKQSLEDARFVKEALKLEESADVLCPAGTAADIKNAYEKVGKGKDIVLLEGYGGLEQGGETSKVAYELAQTISAKVIVIMRYLSDTAWMRIGPATKKFGDNMLGIVINEVPAAKVQSIRTEAKAAFDKEGLKLLGVLPEDRLLMGVSMADLAAHLGSQVLCCKEHMGKMAYNVMVGAFTVDPGVDYFSRKSNKVVIARGDRTDMQIAALNTSTAGLILTGGVAPASKVIYLAEEKKVPVLTTGQETLPTLEALQEAIVQARFRQSAKCEKAANMVAKNLDMEALRGS